MGKTLVAPRSSELSSGFSLRLTHCPLPHPSAGCRRSLPSWGLCTHTKARPSLQPESPSGPRRPRGPIPQLDAFSSYPQEPPDSQRPESSKPKPLPRWLKAAGHWKGCGGVNLEEHQGDKRQLNLPAMELGRSMTQSRGPSPHPQDTHMPRSLSSLQSSPSHKPVSACRHTMPST